MSDIKFLNFQQVNPDDFLVIVNEDSLRTHLIDHDPFTPASIREWMKGKLEVDALKGCCVRAVYVDGSLAGWCGIQPDDKGVELGIVIAQDYWGHGIAIAKTMLGWAKELGHQEVLFHLLETRREYKALSKLASRVQKTTLLGRTFTTYVIPVDKGLLKGG